MAQLNYDLYFRKYVAGLIADCRPYTVETHIASEDILYGLGVVRDQSPLDSQYTHVKIPDAGGQVFRGVAIMTWSKQQDASGDGKYVAKDPVNVLRKGVAVVPVNANVSIDNDVYLVHTGADAGKFRNDGTDADLVPTGVFKTAANTGELAVIEINLP